MCKSRHLFYFLKHIKILLHRILTLDVKNDFNKKVQIKLNSAEWTKLVSCIINSLLRFLAEIIRPSERDLGVMIFFDLYMKKILILATLEHFKYIYFMPKILQS